MTSQGRTSMNPGTTGRKRASRENTNSNMTVPGGQGHVPSNNQDESSGSGVGGSGVGGVEGQPRRSRSRRGHNVQILSPRPERRMSPTETIYPDPDTAQTAFAAERRTNAPLHRRVPTPHSNQRSTDLHRSNSVDSNGSNRSNHSRRSRSRPDSDGESDTPTAGPHEPHFGAARGVGPAGEAIEVIGLGRKEPRHRKYAANLLKPALRPSRDRLRPHDASESRNKPLPTRPQSFIVPVLGGPLTPSPFAPVNNAGPEPPVSNRQSRHQRSVSQPTGLRSLFQALTLEAPSTALSNFTRPAFGRRGSTRRNNFQTINPADDLFTFLRVVEVPAWNAWPGEEGRKSTVSMGFFGGSFGGGGSGGARSKGFEVMPWSWHRRFEAAELGRNGGRSMMAWETSRGWDKKILEWLDENVPVTPIDPENRWGQQIFALSAEGYETLEFCDDMSGQSEDLGLLSWMTGAVMQTAVSALHMLRYSSQSFSFHLIPSTPPQYSGFNSTSSPNQPSHGLWDGMGSLALVNKNNEMDRAMIVEVRPPHIVDGAVMREFAREGRREGWWHLPGTYCVGEQGQANLLQAQVYDACVENSVYFWAVTNTNHWVFGSFNANYTKCHVGPVIDRKQRDPGIMQCLTAWIVRAVDERPRRGDEGGNIRRQPSRSGQHEDVLHYPSPPSQSRHNSQNDCTSPPGPYSQPGYNHSSANFASSYPLPPPSPMGEFGHAQSYGAGLPGYYDVSVSSQMGMGGMTSPQPFHGGMYNTWSSGGGQRAFSPNPFAGGMGWYGGYGWPGMR